MNPNMRSAIYVKIVGKNNIENRGLKIGGLMAETEI